MSEYP